MHEPQKFEFALSLSGKFELHFYLHLDNAAALAKLAALTGDLKTKTDDAKEAFAANTPK